MASIPANSTMQTPVLPDRLLRLLELVAMLGESSISLTGLTTYEPAKPPRPRGDLFHPRAHACLIVSTRLNWDFLLEADHSHRQWDILSRVSSFLYGSVRQQQYYMVRPLSEQPFRSTLNLRLRKPRSPNDRTKPSQHGRKQCPI